MKCLLVASLGLAVLSAVQAQTVWRCGADGSRYADSPCDGGQVVAVADSRSPEQVRAAQALAAREQRVAAQWVSEREQRERVALARGPAGIRAAAAPALSAAPLAPRQNQLRRLEAAGTSPAAVLPFPRKRG